ncbi:hypothetical protein M8C21_008756 [Ambrosia artemisiifolia]|uniref:Uncharacterized protein n=1 Tax=Ambrosia artemisiifolia TaxID=4212 RepID=A0AAD5G2U3_AMBAR|nr:hypothetical protein M8C21_008756 [Ambrosia artemisiifolia]
MRSWRVVCRWMDISRVSPPR